MDILSSICVFFLIYFCLLGAECKQKIRMVRDFKFRTVDHYPVYWNVPTMMCQKYNIDFYQYTKYWGLISNQDDQFRGEIVNILYDPGVFPALLEGSRGRIVERNGGVPQAGNLTYHLDNYKQVLEKLVPKQFSGVGVIDFEAWRPIYRQNWEPLQLYKQYSRDRERQAHPFWTEKQIETEASRNFEGAAKVFMEVTLKLTKLLRPNARWGYYAFPYCFNFKKQNNMSPWCPRQVQDENDRIKWMFDASSGLYPSIYLFKALGTEDNVQFILGRLNEAWRVAAEASRRTGEVPHVYPYIWYRYKDTPTFLSKEDIYNSLEVSRQYKMGGAIIWGSSNDVRTQDKCIKLLNYLNGTLGPTLQGIRNKAKQQSDEFVFVGADYRDNVRDVYHITDRPEKTNDETGTPTPTSVLLLRMLRSLLMTT